MIHRPGWRGVLHSHCSGKPPESKATDVLFLHRATPSCPGDIAGTVLPVKLPQFLVIGGQRLFFFLENIVENLMEERVQLIFESAVRFPIAAAVIENIVRVLYSSSSTELSASFSSSLS